MSKRVIIIGGGLAGIAASCALREAGFQTTLIERREFLGGRATSFRDAQDDALLDNCQHVLLGCCTALLDLYRRLGVLDRIEFFDTIHFADTTGLVGSLYATALPSPLHLAESMLRFKLLAFAQKVEISRAMGVIKILGVEGRNELDGVPFEAWLRDHGQSPETIARYWNVIAVSALNANVDNLSTKYAMQVFQEAFLGDRNAYRMALSAVPLAQLYSAAPAGEIRTGRRVLSLIEETGQVRGVVLAPPAGSSTTESLRADYVVLAAAPDSARLLLGPGRLPQLDRFSFNPIIGAHLWYDRPVMHHPHLALVGTRLHWLFRKDTAGSYLHGVVSSAHDLAELPADAVAALFDAEVHQILPDACNATLLRHRIIKEKRATFAPAPGLDRFRPTSETGIPGLVLAGDYTRTDWPATMEGAVRSGNQAAETILRLEGRGGIVSR